jgi:hypothetical protein
MRGTLNSAEFLLKGTPFAYDMSVVAPQVRSHHTLVVGECEGL